MCARQQERWRAVTLVFINDSTGGDKEEPPCDMDDNMKVDRPSVKTEVGPSRRTQGGSTHGRKANESKTDTRCEQPEAGPSRHSARSSRDKYVQCQRPCQRRTYCKVTQFYLPTKCQTAKQTAPSEFSKQGTKSTT